ncbi:MAG: sigma-70 family RNA polymerase sigma factor [Planctomycetales bacterium]|nr:sigma-70 family RNA polymerase sigma factor [Planctomycetales bacterium]
MKVNTDHQQHSSHHSFLGDPWTSGLIERARSGCNSAKDELIGSVRSYLLLIANQELNPALRAKLGASDVVQSVLVLAEQNLEQFRGSDRESLLAWLRAILKNELHAAHRKFVDCEKRTVRREYNDEAGALAEPLRATGPSPVDAAELNEEAIRLRHALEKLSDDHRTVVMLRNWERMPFEVIGTQMGRSADAAKKLWARAILQLQKELGASQR